MTALSFPPGMANPTEVDGVDGVRRQSSMADLPAHKIARGDG
jgi:hypothetical protein